MKKCIQQRCWKAEKSTPDQQNYDLWEGTVGERDEKRKEGDKERFIM